MMLLNVHQSWPYWLRCFEHCSIYQWQTQLSKELGMKKTWKVIEFYKHEMQLYLMENIFKNNFLLFVSKQMAQNAS